MPITPLHFGLLAVTPKLNTKAFILANVLADIPVLLNMYGNKYQELGGPVAIQAIHETSSHTLMGAMMLGIGLSLLFFWSREWWSGCLIGSLSHVLLDMFVHSDVHPFAPFSNWNPFYFEEAHTYFSLVLSIGLVYWVLRLLDQRKASHQT